MTASAILQDPHGKRYGKVVQDNPEAWAEVEEQLTDPINVNRMEYASESGEPALAGVVGPIEAPPHVRALLSTKSAEADRFKQAIGVAVRLVMVLRGWSTTGRKGSLGRSRWFTRAERYVRTGATTADQQEAIPDDAQFIEAHQDPNYAERVRAALDRISETGTPEEQSETYAYLMKALAETRAEEGRPFCWPGWWCSTAGRWVRSATRRPRP
jgi:hypothetical protein